MIWAARSLSIVPREEWRQIYTESWRMLRDFFYDRDMHDVDWPAMRAKYLPLVNRASDRAELNDVIYELRWRAVGIAHLCGLWRNDWRGSAHCDATRRVAAACRLVTGEVAGACSENVVYSFAASLPFPNLTAPCPPHSRGEAAFFSAATAMDLREIAWQPLDDVVDFTGAAPPLLVPVAAWVAVDYGVAGVAAVKDLIRLDLALASKLMQDARAGVTFVLLGDTIGVVPPDHLAQVGPGCYDVQLADALQKQPEEYVSGYLNLYYVDEILTPPDNTGSRSVLRGETCWRAPGRPEDMILFPVLDRVDVILAHELGHALGLVSPQSGHVHLLGEAGFDQQNLMRDRLNVEDARAQHHLSLGLD